jgi:hypothetical protein
MAHHIDIRVDGVTKMANFIEEIPSFHFDGKEFVLRATLVKEQPSPDVPRMNYAEIQQRLAAEESSAQTDNPQQQGSDAPGQDEASHKEGQGKRRGGRRRGQPSGEAVAGMREAGNEAKKLDGEPDDES